MSVGLLVITGAPACATPATHRPRYRARALVRGAISPTTKKWCLRCRSRRQSQSMHASKHVHTHTHHRISKFRGVVSDKERDQIMKGRRPPSFAPFIAILIFISDLTPLPSSTAHPPSLTLNPPPLVSSLSPHTCTHTHVFSLSLTHAHTPQVWWRR